LRYTPPLSDLVTDLKYRGRLAAGRLLGDLLAEAVAAEPAPDLLVPLPLHAARLAERGFNQATELARSTARRLGLTVVHGDLERRQATNAQTGLTRREREANVRGAFVWKGRKPPAGRVVVIDDVVTTTSTAAAAATALLAAGAASVDVWAVARTPPGAPG
jgi:ComF family protein